LETFFKVSSIPKDSQLREVIDNSDFDKLEEVFNYARWFNPNIISLIVDNATGEITGNATCTGPAAGTTCTANSTSGSMQITCS